MQSVHIYYTYTCTHVTHTLINGEQIRRREASKRRELERKKLEAIADAERMEKEVSSCTWDRCRRCVGGAFDLRSYSRCRCAGSRCRRRVGGDLDRRCHRHRRFRRMPNDVLVVVAVVVLVVTSNPGSCWEQPLSSVVVVVIVVVG
jgi:hypothetical protein